MRKKKGLFFLLVLLMVGLYGSTLYANSDLKTEDESVNVVEKTVMKDGKSEQYLASEDDYIKITQINQNSQNVKIYTSTFDSKLILTGKAAKGTEVVITIYNRSKEAQNYNEEATNIYELKVGVTGSFEQLLELLEGDNKIKLTYENAGDKVEDKMVFYIRRERAEDKEAMKNFLVVVPSVQK